jgi:hypothetical protein
MPLGKALALAREAPRLLESLPETERPKLMAAWEDLARSLQRRATPNQKIAIARVLLEELKTHALDWTVQPRLDRMIDTILGMDAESVTQRIQNLSPEEVAKRYGGENTWYEYDNSLLLTPYFEFQLALEHLKPQAGQTFVDLGSGMGRMGLYMGIQHPGVKFHGYEIVAERVEEGAHAARALGLRDVHFHEQNMADPNWKPEAADMYYAFNPVSDATFDKILVDLKEQAIKHNKPFKLAVSGPAPYFKLESNSSWLREITPPKRFGSDDFTRIFEFDPRAQSIASFGEAISEKIASYPASRPLSAADRAEVESRMAQGKGGLSIYSFPYLWAKSTADDYHLSQKHGLLLLSSEKVKPGAKVFLEPIGGTAEERAQVIRSILEQARPGEHIVFESVSEAVATALKDSQADRQLAALVGMPAPGARELKISQQSDYAEYVYKTSDLVDLQSTKKLRDKRKQVETFWATHNASYRSLNANPELLPKVMEFLDHWIAEKEAQGATSKAFQEEGETSRRMTQNFLQLGLKGGVILVEGKVVGFTLGAPVDKQTFGVFLEKADPKAFPFSYQALNREFAKDLKDRGFEFINRQDDEGEAGLRQAKKSYNPDRMEPHFTVEGP